MCRALKTWYTFPAVYETGGGLNTGKALQDYISKMYESLGETGMYSDFVNWLEDYANQLTAKQYVGDRGFETVFGRESLNLANKITNAFQRSQVAGNISSMLNQGAQSAIIIQECGPRNTMQALYDIANGKLRRDNFVDRSDFLTGKAGINRLIVDPTEKALHLLFTLAAAAGRPSRPRWTGTPGSSAPGSASRALGRTRT